MLAEGDAIFFLKNVKSSITRGLVAGGYHTRFVLLARVRTHIAGLAYTPIIMVYKRVGC
jgi:hypothetical protein